MGRGGRPEGGLEGGGGVMIREGRLGSTSIPVCRIDRQIVNNYGVLLHELLYEKYHFRFTDV